METVIQTTIVKYFLSTKFPAKNCLDYWDKEGTKPENSERLIVKALKARIQNKRKTSETPSFVNIKY